MRGTAARALLIVIALAGSCAAAADRPNILLVLTDDQGAGDLGVAGNPVLETPRLDRLAAESLAFERFYVSPVCTPTRAALLTGRSSPRTAAIDTWRGRAMMAPEEVTIAEVLRAAGYATGLFGKWHLGDCHPMRPSDQGFDRVVMHRAGGLAQPADAIDNDRRYTDAILLVDGVETPTQGYCMDVYVDEAITFMDAAVRDDQPFFAYVATNTPHGPFHDVPADLLAKYQQRDLTAVAPNADDRARDVTARTFAMIENIDQNVGRLLDRLEQLGVADETIVIYLHDNGPAQRRYVGSMRGVKSTVYEGGVRTPFFIRWPVRIPAGVVREEIAAHIDIWPTLVELTGSPLPESVAVDGRSLAPLLTDGPVEWPPRVIHLQAHRGDVRQARHQFAAIGQRFKLLCASGFGREQRPSDARLELYDLVADPHERTNLIDDAPEIAASLLAAHDAWFADVTGDPHDPPRIIVGSDVEPASVLTRNDWRPTEGGGYGRAGTWRLHADAATTVELRALFRTPAISPVISIALGQATATVRAEGSVRAVDLGRFDLATGPLDLHVAATSNGQPIAVEHVVVTRVGRE